MATIRPHSDDRCHRCGFLISADRFEFKRLDGNWYHKYCFFYALRAKAQRTAELYRRGPGWLAYWGGHGERWMEEWRRISSLMERRRRHHREAQRRYRASLRRQRMISPAPARLPLAA